MVYIIKGREHNLAEEASRGRLTDDRIHQLSQTRDGLAALNRRANELYQEKKHLDRVYGEGQWDIRRKNGQLEKGIGEINT